MGSETTTIQQPQLYEIKRDLETKGFFEGAILVPKKTVAWDRPEPAHWYCLIKYNYSKYSNKNNSFIDLKKIDSGAEASVTIKELQEDYLFVYRGKSYFDLKKQING